MEHHAETFWSRIDRLRERLIAGDRDGAADILASAAAMLGDTDPVRAAIRRNLLNDLAARAGLEPVPEVSAPPPAPPAANIGDGTGAGTGEGEEDGKGTAAPALLPPIAPGGRPGISLVTCCMNREANLLRALESWLIHPELTEIVIVDWSSATPVREALQTAGIDDPRIRVIRVAGEPRWVLSYAFNTGFRVAACERILKVDADIVIAPGFFAANPLEPGRFIAGNWRNVPEDQAYVNGFFLAWKDDLAAVGGFNEYITTYGWDDDDLYARLVEAGTQRRDVVAGTIRHLPHSDADRLGEDGAAGAGIPAREELTGSTMHRIRQNRLLSLIMPVWNADHTPLPLRIEAADETGMLLRRTGEVPHPVPPHVIADTHFYALQEMASWRLGREIWSLDRARLDRLLQRPLSELGPEDIAAARAWTPPDPAPAPVPVPALATGRARVFIDAQHGLGNRLRAIASAAAIAARTDRELVVVWQPDDHCDCRFSDLFEHLGAIVEESFIDRAAAMGCTVHNYMEVEEGAEKDAPIRETGGDLYLRSAYVFNTPLTSWEEENRFLRTLRPVAAVRDLVASVRTPNDVSAHVRMAGGAAYEHLPYESRENWTEEGHAEIARWRAKSHFSGFMARIDRLAEEGRAGRIFLAADTPEAYAAFRERYGDRLAALERGLYDRSAEQLRYALADAILLGQSPLLLGSTWSSFSELAMRLAPGELTVEMSGKDF